MKIKHMPAVTVTSVKASARAQRQHEGSPRNEDNCGPWLTRPGCSHSTNHT